MTYGVTSRQGRGFANAECMTCGDKSIHDNGSDDPASSRRWAHTHVEKTGHTVFLDKESTRIYEPKS